MIRSSQDWWKSAILYQIYPRSFLDTTGSGTGDLTGIRSKLGYLNSLGVTDIWISPFFRSPQVDNGYDISDYHDIDPMYGTMNDFDQLITEAKALGLGIIIDLVLNHTSSEHAWFKESCSSKDSPKRDWYIWRKGKRSPFSEASCLQVLGLQSSKIKIAQTLQQAGMLDAEGLVENIPLTFEQFGQALASITETLSQAQLQQLHTYLQSLEKGDVPCNWESYFSGPTWTYDKATQEWYFHLFAPEQPDINWRNPEVREAVYSIMEFWAKKGITGFRLDVINFISKHPDFPDDNDNIERRGAPYYIALPEVHDYLQEAHRRVFGPYKLLTIGEAAHMSIEETLKYVGSDRNELSGCLEFDFCFLDRGVYKYDDRPWTFKDYKDCWTAKSSDFHGRGWMASYIGSHDQPRPLSRYVKKGFEKQGGKMLAGMLLTSPGTPIIYQGDEIGMTNIAYDTIDTYNDVECIGYYKQGIEQGMDPELLLEQVHNKSRDNARTPIQWANEANAGFTSGTPWLPVNPNYPAVNVAQQLEDKESIYHFHCQLTTLRKNHAVLNTGEFKEVDVGMDAVYCYTMSNKETTLLMLLNLSSEDVDFTPPSELISLMNGQSLICSYNSTAKQGKDGIVTLKPYQFEVKTY